MENERVIKVKGTGSLKLKVDYIYITLILDEKNKDYQKGYSTFTQHITLLQESVEKAGFNKIDLKTKNISIKGDYDTVRKNDEYISVFLGYKFYNKMIIGFDFDLQKINKLFSAVNASQTNAEIKIELTVKDKEIAKNKLLSLVSKDAKQKALALCEGMEVKLGKLISMNYNCDELDFKSSDFYTCGLAKSITLEGDFDITPEDITINDDASFIWEITD